MAEAKPRQALPGPRSICITKTGACSPPIIWGSLEKVPAAKSLCANTRTKWLFTRSITAS
jgi:hypothetical protein